MGMILRIASSRIVGQGDIVGRSGYFSLNLSANSVMRGRLDARRTLKSLVADLRIESLDENIFMRGFLTNLYLRPSCYSCQFKSGKSGSDITLGDFWGIDKILPTFDDDKGVSLVLINREEIKSWFEELCQDRKLEKYENALQENSSLLASVTPHRNMKYFYSKMYKGECLQKCISMSLEKKNIKYRLASILYHLCKKN